MSTDPIADMLAKIRNASMVKHDSITVPASKTKIAIAQILKDEGLLFLKTFSSKEPSPNGPFKFSIDDIRSIFGTRFRIDSFKETVYQGTLRVLPKALFIVLRKKKINHKKHLT